jgi:iron complex transport system substrate-binding protein
MKSFIAASLAALVCAGAAQAAPQRVVSLNPCLDVILVNVADREQIAALSHFSRQDTSTIIELANSVPSTSESAEEVMSFAPDLVLTSRHSSLATRNALKRVGIETRLFGEPQTIAESLIQVRAIGALVGHPERGEELATRIMAAVEAAAPPQGSPLVGALLFQSNGFSTGRGSLLDELMRYAGFINVADRYGLRGWGNIPLERVLADPPQLLLAGQARADKPTWADRILRHPALTKLEGRMQRATFPDSLLYCAGPVLIPAAQALHDAHAQMRP